MQRNKKYTQEEAIARFKDKHGDYYDYSKAQYTNNATEVIIICPIHGEFRQVAGEHFRGRGCKACGLKKVARMKNKPFSYYKETVLKNLAPYYKLEDVETQYYDTNTVFELKCQKCGGIRRPSFGDLLRYTVKCQVCDESYYEARKISHDEYIERIKAVHGNKYDYSKIQYKTMHGKINVVCPKHGEFTIHAYRLLQEQGCRKCGIERRVAMRTKTTEQFIADAKMVHGDIYDYSVTIYNGAARFVDIMCKEHGIFSQKANSHLNGFGCPKCKWSHGERTVHDYLVQKNIDFIFQHKFDDCRYRGKLIFDFYIPSKNICIEYDGMQHFYPAGYFGSEKRFEETKIKDNIKNDYCASHGIRLLRIAYNEDCIAKLKTIFE